MNRSGELALIKSTLSAIPIYMAIGLGLASWVQDAFIGIMRAFLWTGSDAVQLGKCMVVWPAVQRPLDLGGLGIIDMKLFGMALRLRWM
jgi:hypothetical protein